MNVVFFGSTADSVLVLEKLEGVVAVVTQPPRPTPTPVESWAHAHTISVTTLDVVAPFKPDLLICASYGEKIPIDIIQSAKFGGLNVHPSLLPRWRGADPVPWAMLAGDHQTGVTILTLSRELDEGKIIAQKKVAITATDEADPLRTRLFALGAELLAEKLPDYLSGSLKGTSQDATRVSLARRFTRDDGFVSWEIIQKAMAGEDMPVKNRPELLALDASHITLAIVKALRALAPWPGVWTEVTIQQINKKNKLTNTMRRLKILACHAETITNKLILDTVQLEGKNPVSFAQFKEAYLS